MIRTLVCLLVLAPLAGCYTPNNSRMTLADTIGLTVFDPDAASTYTDIPTIPDRLDVYRRNWRPLPFYVPVDGTDHFYLARTDSTCTDSTPRQKGQFPTALSAVDVDGDARSDRTQAYEAVEAPFWAAWDALLMAPRLIGWSIANGERAVSPDVDYIRYPTKPLHPSERRIWLGETD